MELKELPTDTNGFSEYDWAEIFGIDRYGETKFREWPSGDDAEPITEKDVAEVVAARSYCSCRTEQRCDSYCDDSYWALVRLHDGRWAGVEAWNDTSGWGCQDGVEWGIAADRETAWTYALSDEGREVLSRQIVEDSDCGGRVKTSPTQENRSPRHDLKEAIATVIDRRYWGAMDGGAMDELADDVLTAITEAGGLVLTRVSEDTECSWIEITHAKQREVQGTYVNVLEDEK